MKKKKEAIIEEVVETVKEDVLAESIKPEVGKLDLSFPNEDLNKLVSKVNEIIDLL